jgi:hypothetical protein
MYYKIINKESEVYKKLHELRTKERQIRKDNEKAIEEKTGLKWKIFLGDNGQQNFRRVPQYNGFKFTEPDKVDLKIWKLHEEHKEIYIPNRKTKLGREMDEFLLNGLKGSIYRKVFSILKLPSPIRRFSLPFVEIVKGDIIILFLGDDQEPKDKNVIEITLKEFNKLCK